MGFVASTDFKKGLKLLISNEPWAIVEAQFVKPGKGTAFTRTKFKNLRTGRIYEENVRSGDGYPSADTEEVEMQYLYKEGDAFVFMNNVNYEQISLTEEQMGDQANWLVDNTVVKVMFFNNSPLTIELPNFIELEITYCEPGVKGDTATGASKTATLSTGATVQVPLFVEQGEVIRVDTREGTYVDRVRRK